MIAARFVTRRRRPAALLGVLALVAAAAALMVGAALPALAASGEYTATHFSEFGSGAGQTYYPNGIAVDASGRVYVSDEVNERVDAFDSAGNFLLSWGVGVLSGAAELQTCTASCQKGRPQGIVGMEAPAGLAADAAGDVYVVDYGHARVEKFGPKQEFIYMIGGKVNTITGANLCTKESECKEGIATLGKGADGEFYSWHFLTNFIATGGPSEALYVGDTGRIQVFDSSGAWTENISLASLSSGGQPETLAVDQAGDIFVKDQGITGVRELTPNGTLISTQFDQGSNNITGVTVDSSHQRLYVGDSTGGFHLLEYDINTGQLIASFGANTVGENYGIAFSKQAAAVYAGDDTHSAVWRLPVPAPGPLIMGSSATPETAEHATLTAPINAEGAETEYHFEYVSRAEYEAGGFAKAASTPTGTVAAGFTESTASASLTKLTAGETYRWRLVAENANGTAQVEGKPFEEISAATIEGPWATAVSGEGATLSAKVVKTQNAATEYRLEYGTDASYGAVAIDGTLGASEASASISRHLQGLQPGTIYHYRVVAENEFGTVTGADHTFTTQERLSGGLLADGRAWELISPADKRGATIEDFEGGYDIQASTSGDGIAYMTNEPLTSTVVGNQSPEEIVSRRGASGWRPEEVTVPAALRAELAASNLGYQTATPPAVFSSDLSRAVFYPGVLTPPLSSEATERTLYLRNNTLCESKPPACYTPLVTPDQIPTGTIIAEETNPAAFRSMRFVGASRDLGHVVFEDPAAFTPEAHSYPLTCQVCQKEDNIYEWGAGKLALVNAFGSGAQRVASPEKDAVYVGGPFYEAVNHAVSADGRRVVWSYAPSTSETIFEIRDMVEEKTVQIGNGKGALFETMSADGSRVFYLEGGDLHMLEFDTGVATDITAQHGPGEASGRVQDAVIGAGEDGKSVYFVAKGVLASGAVPGEDNLYLASEESGAWTIKLIATLSAEDEKDWYSHNSLYYGTLGGNEPSGVTSRVSPNGRFMTFMSDRSLTGYDNIDANSGQPDEEVFLYDASTGHLACASCNPTGARPVGVLDSSQGPLVDKRNAWHNHWLAAILPGWNNVEGGITTYQPRFLLDSGRMFFESPDALVPQDSNGQEDVYEFEPPGVGSCTTTSVGYSERDGGCVSLVSSGTSASESAFYDASESGNDVFFVTASKLVGADHDTSYDVYDAHVCSTALPCATEAVSSPACTTTDACRNAPAPQPTLFGASGSATFSGPGDQVARRPSARPKPKSTAAQRLRRALERCQRRYSHNGVKRRQCARLARRRFGGARHRHRRKGGHHRNVKSSRRGQGR